MVLEDFFLNKRRTSTGSIIVILIDELDALITKKQTLLYNLFNWPAYDNSKLIIIGIANTMDLPERFLGKIRSRLGEQRLVYRPYNSEQIKIILESRLGEYSSVFSTDALRYVSEKVASTSGDLRKALQVCRRAIEIITPNSFKINLIHIIRAFEELFNTQKSAVSRVPCLSFFRFSSDSEGWRKLQFLAYR